MKGTEWPRPQVPSQALPIRVQRQTTSVPCHEVCRGNRKCTSCNTSTAGGRTNLGSMPGFPFTVACKSDTEVTVAGHQSLLKTSVASITFACTTTFFFSPPPPPPTPLSFSSSFFLSCLSTWWQNTNMFCARLGLATHRLHLLRSTSFKKTDNALAIRWSTTTCLRDSDVVHWLLLLSLVSLRRTIAHYVLRPRHTVQLLLSRLLSGISK